MSSKKYKIEIAGSVATGKTKLANQFFYILKDLRIESEDILANPFIDKKFDILDEEFAVERAFSSQATFMLQKITQHLLASQHSYNSVFDYCLWHESGYQKYWLESIDCNYAEAAQRQLSHSFDLMTLNAPKPDVIVRLASNVEGQHANIIKRFEEEGDVREFELDLWTHDNLSRLNDELHYAFEMNRVDSVPVIEFDAIHGKESVEDLIKKILEAVI